MFDRPKSPVQQNIQRVGQLDCFPARSVGTGKRAQYRTIPVRFQEAAL